ncbi:hypothetical protein M8C21_002406 [Ambrosia artemisiifolia]|uniref:WPP domain-containing protein n=1 Tax=Ambrosia artemisiifolia TaxID=4212 RepID=A0AAD5D4Y9_AMBAR|nr:hypothetical protein M8C21_002406 [Ambrosia artemisiifolia]
MTDQTEQQPATITNPTIDDTTTKLENLTTYSFSIWPPTQRTRDAVITRLIQTLTSKSILSDRYGTIPTDQADVIARCIEQEAFNAATASSPAHHGHDDDGIDTLQLYSKEISKRMLDSVKSRSVETKTVEDDKDGDDAVAVENET